MRSAVNETKRQQEHKNQYFTANVDCEGKSMPFSIKITQ